MAKLFDSPFFTAINAAGVPLSGATLTFQLAGTTTATNVFSDRTLQTSIGSVVTADSAGRFEDIWLSDSISYKVILKDAAGATIRTVDYAVQADDTTASNTGATAEFKNVLTNGGFDLWTGGTSFADISGANALVETADDWFFCQPLTASNAISQQAAASIPARYALRMGRPAASTVTNQLRLLQRVPTELVYRLRGQMVTLSLTLSAGANFSGANVSVILATGTGIDEPLTGIAAGTWTGQATPISAAQGVTTTATRYQFTGTLDTSISELGIQIAYTPTGTAGANDWIQLENAQNEEGGSATDFAARFAVLDYLYAASPAATGVGLRTALGVNVSDNRFINGENQIDQRNAGASQTITAGAALAYTIDRWYAYCAGANVTGQQIAGSSPDLFRYRFTGAASVTKIGFATRIEARDCADMAGGAATFGVELANSLLTTVTWTAWYATTTDAFGTLASPTRTQIATGTFTVSATLATYTQTINVPSAATTGIEIEFSVGAQTSGTWTIGKRAFVKGAVWAGFCPRIYQQELEFCRRYARPIRDGVLGAATAVGQNCGRRFDLSPPMRAAPTLPASGLGNTTAGLTATDDISADGFRYFAATTGTGAYEINYSGLATAEL